MGRIVVNANVSLDGVSEDPTGEEGTDGGGWFERMSPADWEVWAKREYEEALRTDALLLGRATDTWFGTRWNEREGDWADRLRMIPKYVVSSTARQAAWVNGTVLAGDLVTEASRLKDEVEGDIVVFGSRRLVRALLDHGLLDELRIFVFPCVVGSGDRLLGETGIGSKLRLTTAERVGDGLLYLAYDVLRS